MKIVTSKDQILVGKEADTAMGLAVIGAVTVLAGASVLTSYVLEKFNRKDKPRKGYK